MFITTAPQVREVLTGTPTTDRAISGFTVADTPRSVDRMYDHLLDAMEENCASHASHLHPSVVMNGISTVREVNIVGDCVWAVYNTPQRDTIDEVFAVAAQGHSLVKILNYKLEKAGYSQLLRCGFGMEYGRALMVKAGYSGSGIADVIYMGDVVNQSAKLASQGSKRFAPPIMVGNTFASNLNEENTRLIQKDWSRDCYTGNVINLLMEDWYQENCK